VGNRGIDENRGETDEQTEFDGFSCGKEHARSPVK
jgi:hypothetical protein